jgi:hypothetical protein
MYICTESKQKGRCPQRRKRGGGGSDSNTRKGETHRVGKKKKTSTKEKEGRSKKRVTMGEIVKRADAGVEAALLFTDSSAFFSCPFSQLVYTSPALFPPLPFSRPHSTTVSY